MFKLLRELCRCVAVMNMDGIRILTNAAKDISSREKYRKPDGALTPKQFDKQVEQVVSMVERNYRKECAA